MKNALITGATKGMGRAITHALAKEGLNLAICSRNDTELTDFKNYLISLYPNLKIVAVKADCSIKDEVINFARVAEHELGFVNVLVNNIGIYEPTSILDDDEFAFERMMNTNLRPSYELYRVFGKKMMQQRQGHVFNVCSIAAIEPVISAGTYSVTKCALLGLTNVMRLEMQPHGVKVTAILPGSTLTSSWDGTNVETDKFILPDDIAASLMNAYKMSNGANVNEIIIKPVFGQV
jgi:short-subunit dehydrogenase